MISRRLRNIVISVLILFQMYSDIFDVGRVHLYHHKVKFYIFPRLDREIW